MRCVLCSLCRDVVGGGRVLVLELGTGDEMCGVVGQGWGRVVGMWWVVGVLVAGMLHHEALAVSGFVCMTKP
jgi:hypothetical protein